MILTTKMHKSFKIVLLGDGEVGKTTWANRLRTRRFENDYNPTLGVELHPLSYMVDSYNSIGFGIWDCSGVERFKGLGDGYYRGVNGAILMCDLTRRETYISLMRWIRDLNRIRENIPIVVCGNKVDREDRVVPFEEGERGASTFAP